MRSLAFLLFASISAFAENAVSFRAEVAPLLHRRCAACHNEEAAKGRYRVDSLARLRSPGDTDLPPIVPGRPEESELYLRLVESAPDERMPQKADALPAAEIALVERWIREGATSDAGDAERPIVELARETLLRSAPERYPRAQPVTALAFSPDSTEIAVSGYGEVTIWNAATGALVRRIGGLPERIHALAWSRARNVIAVAGGVPSQWGGVALVNVRKGDAVQYLCDLPECALSVAFSADGSLLAVGGGDRTLRFFDTANGRSVRVLRQHADWVQSVAFSGDSTRVVTASRDRTSRIFDAKTGELDATYSEHETPLLGAAFVNSGVVASLARGKTIDFWKAENGDRRTRFDELPSEILVIAPSPLGLVTGGADGMVRVFSTRGPREIFTLFGHRDQVQALAFAPSGEVFASGSADGVVCVWSLACGTWTARFVASPLLIAAER